MCLCGCLTCVPLIIAEHGVAFDSRATLTARRLAEASRMTGDHRRQAGKQKSSWEKIRRGTTSTRAIVKERNGLDNFFPSIFFFLYKLTLQNFELPTLRSLGLCLALTKEACFSFRLVLESPIYLNSVTSAWRSLVLSTAGSARFTCCRCTHYENKNIVKCTNMHYSFFINVWNSYITVKCLCRLY